MALIDHIDPVNRDIYLSADTVGINLNPIDIYKEMRTLRAADESLRKFTVFLEAKGRDPKGGGKYTERYVVEKAGTRIIPYGGTSHTLTVVGTIITDDGQEGIACFDRSPLSPTIRVDINYVPPQVEVLVVTVSGSNVITGDIADIPMAPSASAVATAVLAAASTTPIASDVTKVNGTTVSGSSFGGGLTPEQDALLGASFAQATLARQMQTNKAVVSTDGRSVNIYADDGTTLLHSFAISADKNTRTPIGSVPVVPDGSSYVFADGSIIQFADGSEVSL